jgi:hypothetical protein
MMARNYPERQYGEDTRSCLGRCVAEDHYAVRRRWDHNRATR